MDEVEDQAGAETLQPLTSLPDPSPPDVAAKNINNANLFGVDPTQYKSMASDMDGKADAINAPQDIEPPVAKSMAQSSEHAALMTPDVPHLNFMSKAMKWAGDIIHNVPTDAQKIIDLNNKKLDHPDQFTADDDIKLSALNMDAGDEAINYHNEPPSFVSKVGEGFDETARGLRRNADLIGSFTAGGAGIGFLFGGAGALPGALTGLGLGVESSFALQGYDTTRGSVYNELSNWTKPDGTPMNIDDTTKRHIATGMGVVAAGVMATVGKVATKASPFLSKFVSPQFAKTLLQDPLNQAIASAVGNIGESMVAGGGAAALLETTHIVAQEMASNYDGTEASFLNAIQSAASKIRHDKTTQDRLIDVAGVGSVVAGGFAAGFGAARIGKAGFDARNVQAPNPDVPLQVSGAPGEPPGGAPPAPPKDVTPKFKLKSIPTEFDALNDRAGVLESLLNNAPEKPNANESKALEGYTQELEGIKTKLKSSQAIRESTDVLHLQDALESMNHGADQTKTGELAPHEMEKLQGEVADHSGLKSVFLMPEDLRAWAINEKKGAAARDLISSRDGIAKGQMNAPIEVDTEKFSGFIKKNPDASDLVRQKADGPSAGQARKLLTAYQDQPAERINILKKLGLTLTPEEPIAKSNVTDLKPALKELQLTPEDTEALVRRADVIMKENERRKGNIQASSDSAEFEKMWDQEMNTADIGAKKTEKSRANFVAMQNVSIKKNEAELDVIKEQIRSNFMKEPGKLLVADWGISDEEAANRSESQWMNDPVFTKMLEQVLPKPEIDKFRAAVEGGRKEIQEDINFTLKHEMTKVQTLVQKIAAEDALEEAKAQIENDPGYAIVDKFRAHKQANAQGKKAKSIYLIDPRTLRDDQLPYTDNERMKEHGVFGKGGEGMSPDEAAQWIGGVANGDELLKVLASTPTRKETIKVRANIRKAQDEKNALEGVDFNWVNKLKSYDNRVKMALMLAKYMREKEWPAFKQGIKRVAFPPPQPEEIQNKARMIVRKSKVGDLSVNRWKIGENQSRKIAVTAYLNGQFAKAHVALEAQALNIQMQKHTLLAQGELNKALNFAAKFREKSTIETLRQAGPVYVNAYQELADHFNLDPSKKGTSKRDGFMKFVQMKLHEGAGDFSIPDEFTDLSQSLEDMTVEQVLLVVSRLRAILHSARLKNRLVKSQKRLEEQETMEMLQDQVKELLTKNPDYNKGKIPPIQEGNSQWDHVKGLIASPETLFSNMEHIVRRLDEGKFNGFFQRLLMHRVKGDGEYEGTAYTRELEMTKHFREHHDHLAKAYGEEDFKRSAQRKYPQIKEFANIRELNYGKDMTKTDLWSLWAMGGDPYLKQKRFENNGGVSHETFQKVFDRLLEDRDVNYVQGVIDMYKDYRPETLALQKRTTGQDVTFVEGIPNKFRDRVLSGGYLPAKYRVDYTAESIKQARDDLKGRKAAWFEKDPMRNFAAEATEQGRLISRTGSKAALDYSWMRILRGHEEVIHDLCYREAVMDLLKILKDKEIREHIISTVGVQNYNQIVNTVIELATKAQAENLNYFSDQNRYWKSMYGWLMGNFNVTVLGANPTSVLIQAASSAQVVQNMGLKGAKHYAWINAKMLAHPHLYPMLYQFANEIEPTIGHFLEQLENKLVSNVMEVAPKKNKNSRPVLSGVVKLAIGATPRTAGVAALDMDTSYKGMVKGVMSPMQIMDVFIKVQSATACYSQFMAGDVDGWPLERVRALSPKEQDAQAKAYARQISRLSLTHGRPEDKAAFQKMPGADLLANYWNDARNVLNNIISQGRRSKWQAQKAYEKVNPSDEAPTPPGITPKTPQQMNNYLGKTDPFGTGGRGGPPDDGSGGGGSGGGGEGGDEVGKGRDIPEAVKHLGGGAGIILGTMLCQMVGRVIEDYMHSNQPTPLDQGFDKKTFTTKEGLKDFAEYMAGYMMMSPVEQLMSSTPVVRSTAWAAQNMWQKSKTKRVDLPFTKILSDFATDAAFLSDYLQTGVSPSSAQMRALLNGLSYTVLPVPVNGFYKMARYMDNIDMKASVAGQADKLKSQIEDYKKQHGGEVKPEVVATLDHFDSQLGPKTDAIPEGTADAIKFAESGGQWSVRQPSVYGFTVKEWNTIAKNDPELGLTENGRVSKDTLQQELAMDSELRANSQAMNDKQIPINAASLFGAHSLGIENYEKVFRAPGDTKVKTVLGAEVLKEHPELANFKTIGQVKSYFSSKIEQGRKATTDKLTSPTANNED